MLNNASVHMVIVSILASATLFFFFLFYSFIFPKKKMHPLVLLLLISSLPLLSILRTGTYESGDLSWHSYASLSFYHALFEGQIIPRWGGELVNGFGSPLHMLMYLFPYYTISFIHFLGLTILNSIKLYLMISYIISGIAMYYLVKDQYGNKSAVAAAIFYLFAPYHLVDMHFRVDLGEMAAFALLPLTFLFTNKIIESKNIIYFVLGGLSVAFLILAHQAISLFFFPFIVIYAVLKLYTNKIFQIKRIVLCLGSIISGIFFASFYWIPIVFEATKYTHYGQIASVGKVYLYDVSWYLVSPWRWGFLFQGPTGQLSFIIGYTQLAMVILAIFTLMKKKVTKKNSFFLKFFLLSFFFTFFIMLPQSNFLWNIVPLAKYTANTYRYLLPLSFFTAVIAGIIIKNFKNLLFILICFITIGYTILNWGNRGTIPTITADSYFENGIPTFQAPTFQAGKDGNSIDEFTSPIWLDTKKTSLNKPTAHLELLLGNAEIKELSRSSVKHEYLVHSTTATTLKENTIYFPGWELKANNHKWEIDYQNVKYPGLAIFSLPKGLYKIELIFQNTPTRTIGDMVTFTTSIFYIIVVFYSIKKKKIFMLK